jgi:hypothetical protein
MERSKSPIYAWREAHKAIDEKVRSEGSASLIAAWQVAQAIIEAQARASYPEESLPTALARAWEDFEMACRGVGQPGVSGAIFMLWSRTLRRQDGAFQTTLTRAFAAAVLATERAGLRYPMRLRSIRVATLRKGFGLAEAPPTGVDGTIPAILMKTARFDGPAPEAVLPELATEDANALPQNVLLFPTVGGEH